MTVLERFLKARFPSITISKETDVSTKRSVNKRAVADFVITLPSHGGRRFIVDVVVCNPSAPCYRNRRVRAHEVIQAANNRRDQFKIDHYHRLTSPDITRMSPQAYYTFNVEATGRLGPAAEKFVQDLYRACGRASDLDVAVGPSPILALTRDVGTVIAKYNAQVALSYIRESSAVLVASHQTVA